MTKTKTVKGSQVNAVILTARQLASEVQRVAVQCEALRVQGHVAKAKTLALNETLSLSVLSSKLLVELMFD